MLTFDEELQVMVAMAPVDMRCSIDGLTYKILDCFDCKPQSKTLFVFYNKSRNKVKALLWDSNGFILLYKRLEQGRFQFPKALMDNGPLTITQMQLQGLLAGFDFVRMAQYPQLDFQSYF